MKDYFQKLFEKAVEANRNNIISLLENNYERNYLDLGCDDGNLTIKFAKAIGTKNIYGVEIVDEKIKIAEGNGIKIKKFDLNSRFDLKDDFFDVVSANQVVEHVHDSDNFLSEIYRILKPDGYAIISTENASSWCNIFASIFGWQIFSLTNFSDKKQGIGNPLALHRNSGSGLGYGNHVRIYNIRGLKEYFDTFGFKVEEIKGAGYFPFPAGFGNYDKTHCHFMTFKIRKNV